MESKNPKAWKCMSCPLDVWRDYAVICAEHYAWLTTHATACCMYDIIHKTASLFTFVCLSSYIKLHTTKQKCSEYTSDSRDYHFCLVLAGAHCTAEFPNKESESLLPTQQGDFQPYTSLKSDSKHKTQRLGRDKGVISSAFYFLTIHYLCWVRSNSFSFWSAQVDLSWNLSSASEDKNRDLDKHQ